MKTGGLSRFQVHALGVLALGIMFVSAYMIAIEPALTQKTQSLRIASQCADVEREAGLAETNVRSDRRELERRRDQLAGAAVQLESASRLNDRMVRLTRLAESRGMSVTALEPGVPQPGPRHTLVGFRFVGTGTFSQFTAMIATMRQEFPDIRVDSFELARKGESDEARMFTLTGTWFAQGASGAVGANVTVVPSVSPAQ